MPHPRDADHFFSFFEGAWILRWAEGREATGTTRAGVEADRPASPLERPRGDSRRSCTTAVPNRRLATSVTRHTKARLVKQVVRCREQSRRAARAGCHTGAEAAIPCTLRARLDGRMHGPFGARYSWALLARSLLCGEGYVRPPMACIAHWYTQLGVADLGAIRRSASTWDRDRVEIVVSALCWRACCRTAPAAASCSCEMLLLGLARPRARQPPARMAAPLPIEQIITDSLDRHAQRLQKLLPSEEPRLVRLQEATPDDWRLVIDGLAPFLKEKKLRSYQDVLGRRRAALQILIENVADPHNAQAALTVGRSPRQSLTAALFEPAKKLRPYACVHRRPQP